MTRDELLMEVSQMVCIELDLDPSEKVYFMVAEAIQYAGYRPESKWRMKDSKRTAETLVHKIFRTKILMYCAVKICEREGDFYGVMYARDKGEYEIHSALARLAPYHFNDLDQDTAPSPTAERKSEAPSE